MKAASAPPLPEAQRCLPSGVVVLAEKVHVSVQERSNYVVGTVARSVVGGVAATRSAGGGKTAPTVLGAVRGALADREIERNITRRR